MTPLLRRRLPWKRLARTNARTHEPIVTSSEPPLAESEIDPSDDRTELLWARGFLLTAAEHPVPVRHWRRTRIGPVHLSHDPRTPLAIARSGPEWVALLGRAIDLETWESDGPAVAEALLRARLSGRESMLERIDMLSGRFAVFDGDDRSAHVQTDAAGMRGVFYRQGETFPCVASHAGLVAEVTGAGPSAFPDPELLRREHTAYALPGVATTFENVAMLTPNTELDCREGRVRRVFPRTSQERRSTDEVIDALLPLLQGQLRVLTEREQLEVSLTAGLDSRTTLALTKPFTERLTYFTYDALGGRGPSRRGVEHDVEIAGRLAEAFGLSHQRIEVPSRTVAGPLGEVMERNSPRRSNPGMAASHRAEPGERGLHLRSNLYEIGRAFWRGKRDYPKRLDGRDMSALLTKNRSRKSEFSEAFEEYIAITEFDRAQKLYDPVDLLYWEHRSGTWLNAHLTESDIAFDTFILVNSRHIYRLLLSAPLADRIDAEVFLGLARRTWPEVLEFPVNGKMLA